MNQLQPAPLKPASRKGRPSADASQKKMAEVLRVARVQFCRQGYRATTMESIAAEADVSKRTLYKWHSDKTALFQACVIEGSQRFPIPSPKDARDPADVLREFAIELLCDLTLESTYRLGLLLFRESHEFPDIAITVDAEQKRSLSDPLAIYLRAQGLENKDSSERANLLLSMILSDFHQRLMFSRPMPTDEEIQRHATLAITVFLNGCKASLAAG